jgi:hypothetical protein
MELLRETNDKARLANIAFGNNTIALALARAKEEIRKGQRDFLMKVASGQPQQSEGPTELSTITSYNTTSC